LLTLILVFIAKKTHVPHNGKNQGNTDQQQRGDGDRLPTNQQSIRWNKLDSFLNELTKVYEQTIIPKTLAESKNNHQMYIGMNEIYNYHRERGFLGPLTVLSIQFGNQTWNCDF
jgi:hypothetical protein